MNRSLFDHTPATGMLKGHRRQVNLILSKLILTLVVSGALFGALVTTAAAQGSGPMLVSHGQIDHPPVQESDASFLSGVVDRIWGLLGLDGTCQCLEYVRLRFWPGAPRNIPNAYQAADARLMYDRGYSQTRNPGNGTIVIFQRSAEYWSGSPMRRRTVSAASGHAGWISSQVTVDASYRYFTLTNANMDLSALRRDAGCDNVSAGPIAVPRASTAHSYWNRGTTCWKRPYGDANCDGQVNTIDYSICIVDIRAGSNAERSDFNFDGVVNVIDLAIVRANLGG